LSPIEHRKSPRPSFFIITYLLFSVTFDVARTRTAWLLASNDPVAAVITASLVSKLTILVLEAVDKRGILVESYRYLSHETTSGPLNRGVFWWLTPLLADGWKRVLSVSDLFSISEKLASVRVEQKLRAVWEKGKSPPFSAHFMFLTRATISDHWKGRNSLALSTMWAWRYEIAKIMFPRFCVVALQLSQPFLIQRVIETLSDPDSIQMRNHGYGLIGAVAIVYLGTAVR